MNIKSSSHLLSMK